MCLTGKCLRSLMRRFLKNTEREPIETHEQNDDQKEEMRERQASIARRLKALEFEAELKGQRPLRDHYGR